MSLPEPGEAAASYKAKILRHFQQIDAIRQSYRAGAE